MINGHRFMRKIRHTLCSFAFVILSAIAIAAESEGSRIVRADWLVALKYLPDADLHMFTEWMKLRKMSVYTNVLTEASQITSLPEKSYIYFEVFQAGSIGIQNSIYLLTFKENHLAQWYPYEHAPKERLTKRGKLPGTKKIMNEIESLTSMCAKLPACSIDNSKHTDSLDGAIYMRIIRGSEKGETEKLIGGWASSVPGRDAGRIASRLAQLVQKLEKQ
jgi:hypothetical protein